MSDPNPNPNTTHSGANGPAPDELDKQIMDPRDLVNKGGYRKHPREIVENPAVTPQMLDEPQESGDSFIRADRDEAEQ
jgi:hypothetical protein